MEPIALEISHHLASGSHLAQAAAVLNQLIKSNLPGVSVKTVIALARITYDMASDSKSWEYAAELWNLVMAEGPDNPKRCSSCRTAWRNSGSSEGRAVREAPPGTSPGERIHFDCG